MMMSADRRDKQKQHQHQRQHQRQRQLVLVFGRQPMLRLLRLMLMTAVLIADDVGASETG